MKSITRYSSRIRYHGITEYSSEDRVQWTVLLSILLESDTEEVLQSTVMEVSLNILSSVMPREQYQ
jgi:hypothetical protein